MFTNIAKFLFPLLHYNKHEQPNDIYNLDILTSNTNFEKKWYHLKIQRSLNFKNILLY